MRVYEQVCASAYGVLGFFFFFFFSASERAPSRLANSGLRCRVPGVSAVKSPERITSTLKSRAVFKVPKNSK